MRVEEGEGIRPQAGDVQQQLAEGRLVEVMPDWACMGEPLCMYYPSRRQSQPGLRQLMDIIRMKTIGSQLMETH